MAEVFEAVLVGEQGFERRVALKRVLPGRERDPELVEMFADEARIAARLSHLNILAVMDFGMWDEAPFQVLELIDGLDLSSLYKLVLKSRRGFPVALALFICAEIARGLHHAHTATDSSGQPLGIVHRDVKPANILVAWDGSVKIADFGIALAHQRLSQRTQTGIVKGTPAFMAPEHTMGCRVDARADVFALASVLHYLLMGVTPISMAESPMTVLRKQIVPVHADVPPVVRAMLEHALAFDVEARMPTAAMFAECAGQAIRELGVQDPRGALSRFLLELRPLEEKPTPLAMVVANDILLAREAHSLIARTMPRPTVPPQLATGYAPHLSSPPPNDTSRIDIPMTTSRAPVLGAIAGACAVIGAVAAVFLARSPQAAPRASMEAVAIHTPSSVVDLPLAAPPTSSAPSASAPTHSTAPTTTAPREVVVAETAPTSTATAAPGGVGTLVVAGAAVRKQVTIDGVPRGTGPIEVELPVGAHTVSFADDVGRPMGAQRVVVQATHTPSAPLRWLPR